MTILENSLNVIKKAYNIGYKNLMYTIGFSSASGLGNGLGNLAQEKSFSDGVGQGCVNHFPSGFLLAFAYIGILNYLKKTNHYRLYANLMQVGFTTTFLTWHYCVGTDNPLQTMMPVTAIGLMMVNNQVSKDSLENKLNNQS